MVGWGRERDREKERQKEKQTETEKEIVRHKEKEGERADNRITGNAMLPNQYNIKPNDLI